MHVRRFEGSIREKVHCTGNLKIGGVRYVTKVRPSGGLRMFVRGLLCTNATVSERRVALLVRPVGPFSVPNCFLGSVRRTTSVVHHITLPGIGLRFSFCRVREVCNRSLSVCRGCTRLISRIRVTSRPNERRPKANRVGCASVLRCLDGRCQNLVNLRCGPRNEDRRDFT